MEGKKCEELSSVNVQDLKPHFLFNALNSIKCSVILDTQNKVDLIDDFAAFLRYVLKYSSCEGIIAAQEVFAFLHSYARLEEARYDQIKIIFEVETLHFGIEPMVLFELVYNAIHHGLRGNAPEGRVWIRAKERDEKIYINIEDNGIGFNKEKEAFSEVEGSLFEIRENLRKRGASIEISSQFERGTFVEIEYEKIGE